MLITIEGPDKAGKSTQLKLLEDYAKANSKNWVFTKNPGGTALGDKLREIVLDDQQTISDQAELMIYLADRAHHIDHLIKPAIDEGKVVICDRFVDSTVAYQGYGRGMDIDLISKMNNLVCRGVQPELTILLTVTEEMAEERSRGETKDRIERENKLFFVRVRNGYMALARQEPTRFSVLENADKSVEEIHNEIVTIIENKLAKQKEEQAV